MKILVTGGNGMLAHDLRRILGEYSCEVVSCDIVECDITNISSITTTLTQHHPDIVINCAAYTAVDQAQSDGAQQCYRVNTLGTANLAKICYDLSIGYITISTDYVFGGDQPSGYLPTDTPKPLNIYGMSKRLGEQSALLHNPDTIIVRTSRLYGGGSHHKHFVSTMLQLSQDRDMLSIVDDQHGLPMYTVDLCHYLYHICMQYDHYCGRTLHATNTGEQITRYEFASEIFRQADIAIDVQPYSTDQFPRPAPRPQWSCLLSDDLSYQMPDWQDALRRYLQSVR